MNSATQRVKQANLIGTVNDLLRQLDGNTKTAEAKSEAGGYKGETTHPVKNVDDRLEDAPEGFRSSENVSDNKEDQPVGVDSTAAGTPGGQDSVQMDVGITSKETGDDPSAETESAKGGKDDPGSSHPARTDNNSLEGGKYASAEEQFYALCKQAQELGNDVLATISVEASQPKGVTNPTKAATAEKPAEAASNVAPEATTSEPADLDKQAVDNIVLQAIAETVASAHALAYKSAAFLTSYAETKRKQAEDGPPEEDKGAPKDSGGAPGDAAPGGEDPGMLAALMGGGGGGGPAGAGGPPPGAGGPPPGPDGAGGPPAGPDGAGGGGEVSEHDLAMLAQILADAGISPEDLANAQAGAGGGGAPGGADLGAGGPPGPGAGGPGGEAAPMGAPPAGPPKMASQTFWVAKTAADRAKYARMKQHVLELVAANSRR